LGAELQSLEAIGGLEGWGLGAKFPATGGKWVWASPSAGRFLQTHFYTYFGQNRYIKAKLKAFEKQSKRTK